MNTGMLVMAVSFLLILAFLLIAGRQKFPPVMKIILTVLIVLLAGYLVLMIRSGLAA